MSHVDFDTFSETINNYSQVLDRKSQSDDMTGTALKSDRTSTAIYNREPIIGSSVRGEIPILEKRLLGPSDHALAPRVSRMAPMMSGCQRQVDELTVYAMYNENGVEVGGTIKFGDKDSDSTSGSQQTQQSDPPDSQDRNSGQVRD